MIEKVSSIIIPSHNSSQCAVYWVEENTYSLCLGVEKNIFQEIMYFHWTYMATPQPWGHKIYNFGRPFLGHHYFILVSSMPGSREEYFLKKLLSFHEKEPFYFVCLFVWGWSSHSRICHSHWDVTIKLPVKGCKFWPMLGTHDHLAVMVL